MVFHRVEHSGHRSGVRFARSYWFAGSARDRVGRTIEDMAKKTPMTQDAKARIQSAAAKNPTSPTARTDFDRRAQSGADRNAHQTRREK